MQFLLILKNGNYGNEYLRKNCQAFMLGDIFREFILKSSSLIKIKIFKCVRF